MADEINLGGKLYICATAQASNLTEVQFEALTWVEIEQVLTMPSIGETDNFVSQTYVKDGRARFKKGVTSGNATEIVVGYDYSDAGQDALATASASRNIYAFKRVLTDSPNDVTTTNTIYYFRALVGAGVDSGGAVEDFTNITYPIQITDQAPIRVEPEAI